MNRLNMAVIFAGGQGTRLRTISNGIPKPLVEINGKPIIEYVIRNSTKAGIRKFYILTKYRHELFETALNNLSADLGIVITCFSSEVSKMRHLFLLMENIHVEDNFLILDGDQLFDSEIVSLLGINDPGDGLILAVDNKITISNNIIDIEGIMRVKIDSRSNSIKQIGKELTVFNAFDTGIHLWSFKLRERLGRFLDESHEEEISQSKFTQILAEEGRVKCMDIGPQIWVSINTPNGYKVAKHYLDQQELDIRESTREIFTSARCDQ
jgi:choline kinase